MYTLKVLIVVTALACSIARQFPEEDEYGSPKAQTPRILGTYNRLRAPKYRRQGGIQKFHRGDPVKSEQKIEDTSLPPLTTTLATRIPPLLHKMLKETNLLPGYLLKGNYVRAVKSSTTPETYLDTISPSPTHDGMETISQERSSASRLHSFFGFSLIRQLWEVMKYIVLSVFIKDEDVQGLELKHLDGGTSEEHNEVIDKNDIIRSWLFSDYFLDDDVKEVVLQSFLDESEEKEPKDVENSVWEGSEDDVAKVSPNANLIGKDGGTFAAKPEENRFYNFDSDDYENVTELWIMEEATVDGLATDFARVVRQGSQDPDSKGPVSDEIGPLIAALTIRRVRLPVSLVPTNKTWRKIMREGDNTSPIQKSSTEKMRGTVRNANHFGNKNHYDTLYGLPLLIAVCIALTVAIVGFVFGWSALNRKAKAAAEVDYPAYGVTGPSVVTTGDRRLAHSAHIYHYQHQKQQIIAMEKPQRIQIAILRNEDKNGMETRPGSVSDPESEEDNDDGDYTVYECPGLATTGDMEVKNPMFTDEPTPAKSGAECPKAEE